MKVTVPVGLPAPLLLTVAVKVTIWPNIDGLAEELTAVVVAVTLAVTVCVSVAEELIRKLLSPAYVAVMA